MDFKPIVKHLLTGGMVASMACMTFAPLSEMNITNFPTSLVYAAEREIHPFQQTKQYNNNFSDVPQSEWFYNSVAQAYNYDLVSGKSATKFDPKGNVTIAEVITMADKLHSYGRFGQLSPSIQMEADPWYTLFVRYAEVQQIIPKGEFSGEYDRPATREELAHIFANVLPDNGYQQINVVTKLPDVDSSNKYYNDIIKRYNAGILSGNDYSGTFTPKSNITRAEAAAIASRLALPSNRVQLTFCYKVALPPEDNSFGTLKKIGTEVISREERDKQREQQQQTETITTSTTTTTTVSSSHGGTNGRYNYNYTWDYATNSKVDPKETRRLQRENGYNTSNEDDRREESSRDNDRKETTSSNSNKTSSTSNKYETDSKGYLTFDSFVDAVGYTQAEIDRIGYDEIRDYYENDYLRCMKAVSNTYSKNDSSYDFRGKTYYDYYDFLYAVSIDFCNDGDVFERDGKIYFDHDEYTDVVSNDMLEEDQWNIEHYAEGTLELVNEARAEEGLPALSLDPDLVEVAEIRAKELSEYFSHTRPDGSDSNTAIREYTSYFFGTENIAKGTSSAINIQAWLSSSGHRKAIMGEKYQYYGAAKFIDSNGTAYAVQVFGGN